jgi:hypothetical protein
LLITDGLLPCEWLGSRLTLFSRPGSREFESVRPECGKTVELGFNTCLRMISAVSSFELGGWAGKPSGPGCPLDPSAAALLSALRRHRPKDQRMILPAPIKKMIAKRVGSRGHGEASFSSARRSCTAYIIDLSAKHSSAPPNNMRLCFLRKKRSPKRRRSMNPLKNLWRLRSPMRTRTPRRLPDGGWTRSRPLRRPNPARGLVERGQSATGQ